MREQVFSNVIDDFLADMRHQSGANRGKHDAQKNDAPVVVAKGQDYVAQKIKEIARDNNIHIVENKPLARMLFHNVDLGAEIPPELYRSVAEILAMIYKENN